MDVCTVVKRLVDSRLFNGISDMYGYVGESFFDMDADCEFGERVAAVQSGRPRLGLVAAVGARGAGAVE